MLCSGGALAPSAPPPPPPPPPPLGYATELKYQTVIIGQIFSNRHKSQNHFEENTTNDLFFWKMVQTSGSQLYFRIPPLQTQTLSVPLRQKSQTNNY